jgi:nucleoside-diphosphate-sugar epimerase
MIESSIKGTPFEAWVTPETSIPIMYIKDAIRSLIDLFDAEEKNLKTRVYNVGQILPSPSAGELLKELQKHFQNVSITFRPDPKAMEVLQSIPKQLDDQKARSEWGWSIRYGMKEMVEDFIREYR